MNKILLKKNNETIDNYIDRLFQLKQELALTWDDVRDIANEQTGLQLGSDSYRKRSARQKLNKVKVEPDTSPNEELISNTYEAFKETDTDEVIALKKERIKISDERSQVNALYRRIAREETIKDIAHDTAAQIKKRICLDDPKIITSKNNNKVAILQLSDIHYGIEDETRWNTYSPEIAKKRINKLQDKVIEYLQKEQIDTLYLVNLGDMIGGRIHLQLRLNSRIDVVTQAIEISEIISEFTNNLSHYAKVHCYFTTDNHGRLEPKISDAIDLESLSRLTPWYMKERLKDNKNVILNVDEKYGDDIVIFNVLGHNIACCHGHKDKPQKIVSNLSLYTQEHFDMILSSHFHHLAVEENDATIVVYNGSILSTDAYAEKFRLNSRPSQNLIICSEDDVMECLYKIDLT